MKNIKNLIEDDLKYIDKILNLLFENNNEVLFSLKNFLFSSEKRIRSIFIILLLKSIGITQFNQKIFEILVAGELIHNASLLHDDVIDNSEYRRNNETLNKLYSPKISILLGDLLAAYSTEYLNKINNPEVIFIFQDCIKKMSNAEIDQFLLRNTIPSLEEYIEICKGKTASLFLAIMKSILVTENMLQEYHVKIIKITEQFGLLYQIKNDIEKKSSEIDQKNGIYTIKDIIGLEKTNDLVDNYMEMLRRDLEEFPENVYKKALLDLLVKI